MAALIDASEAGRWPVADGAWPHSPGSAPPDRSIGPDLLAEAAVMLPVVVGRGRVRWVDIHAAIYRAACMQGVGRDRPHRLRLADETLDMFTGYLVSAGLAGPRKDPALGWLAYPELLEVQLTLAAAAGYWRHELAAAGVPTTRPDASIGQSTAA